jgi:hypothetical protein
MTSQYAHRTESPATTVAQVLRSLLLHPKEMLLGRWNWKAAILASVLRGLIFFVATLKAGWHAAVGAMLVECAYRAVTSGFWGAITQAFKGAEPGWLANLAVLILVPLLAHGLQLIVHLASGTKRLWASMLSSIALTVVSTLFNLYAMRHGALLVGPESRGFGSDLSRLPKLIIGFLAAGPRLLFRLFE